MRWVYRLLVACALSWSAQFSFAGSWDVLILGEVHDNPDHHAYQAARIGQDHPRAIVYEMLTPDQAAALQDLLEGGADANRVRLALEGWQDTWPGLEIYTDVMVAEPTAKVFGALVPRSGLMQAMRGEGASDYFGADAARYGLTDPLTDEQQADREALQMTAHCNAMPEAMLPGMVMAQRLRDAVLARAVVEAFDQTDGPVIVITGNGHARTDWGLPAVLAQAALTLRVWSVGQLEGEPGSGADPFDQVRWTEAVDRPDPCLQFRQSD